MCSSPASEPRTEQAAGPLFVVSMWRSGSSLLYALLNKHPQVGLMYEADLLLLRPVFLNLPGLRDWAHRWEFWNQAFTRHGLNPEDFADPRSIYREAFERVHKEFARQKGATIWGDKSPNYYDRLQEMAETFPDAWFIIVWRDPLETANSILRAAQPDNPYFGRKGSILRALVGSEVFKRQSDWLRWRGRRLLEISYEDLVRDPASTMEQVCRFLNIEYSGDLARLDGADRSAIYGGEHHALVKGNEIVARPRPNIVDSRLAAKIDRYVESWRRNYAGSWPPVHRMEGLNARRASFLEQALDKLYYRAFRAYDTFTASCFSFLPFSLLAAYRRHKYAKLSLPIELSARSEPSPAEKALSEPVAQVSQRGP